MVAVRRSVVVFQELIAVVQALAEVVQQLVAAVARLLVLGLDMVAEVRLEQLRRVDS